MEDKVRRINQIQKKSRFILKAHRAGSGELYNLAKAVISNFSVRVRFTVLAERIKYYMYYNKLPRIQFYQFDL